MMWLKDSDSWMSLSGVDRTEPDLHRQIWMIEPGFVGRREDNAHDLAVMPVDLLCGQQARQHDAINSERHINILIEGVVRLRRL